MKLVIWRNCEAGKIGELGAQVEFYDPRTTSSGRIVTVGRKKTGPMHFAQTNDEIGSHDENYETSKVDKTWENKEISKIMKLVKQWNCEANNI